MFHDSENASNFVHCVARFLRAFSPWDVTRRPRRGRRRQPTRTAERSAADVAGVAPLLQAIAASGNLADLHAPNFTDYRYLVVKFYQSVNYAPVWVRNGQPTPQALTVIAALENSVHKGLNPEDYDASLWPQRLNAFKASSGKRRYDREIRRRAYRRHDALYLRYAHRARQSKAIQVRHRH